MDKRISSQDVGIIKQLDTVFLNHYQQAAKTLAEQRQALGAIYANAPAAVQVQIRSETNNLGDFSDQLVNGKYDGASRKSLQSQSFNTRNSK